MIKFFTSLLGLGGKALDRILPDRARLQEKNLEINAETERASGGRLTPRRLMMYLRCLLFAWEAVARPVLVTCWPDLTLPPSMGKEIWLAVSALFGMGFWSILLLKISKKYFKLYSWQSQAKNSGSRLLRHTKLVKSRCQ